MKHQAKSVRAFIGAKDFEVSRNFYKDLGFQESIISKNMSYFKIFETLGFYLQNAYVTDWVNNSMIFQTPFGSFLFHKLCKFIGFYCPWKLGHLKSLTK